ncbi:MAG TPA: ROK family protein [Anaeromyxobacteraceae bacterium]|nr:ROK family protein [Anaeromyxobacteraceae bacterium]
MRPTATTSLKSGFPATAGRPVGSNQVGMRKFNERVVLQAIRLHGALPKADVARLTRLSTQTASVIINGLLEDGLVVKKPRVRGRIGQPSVPIALNPDGAFTLGIKVGRRSLDVLAMDFVGAVRHRESLDYPYPDPKLIFPAVEARLKAVGERLGERAFRVVGVGVAAPLWIGGWREFLGAPAGVMARWKGIDIRRRIEAMTGLPVEFAKDTTAACAAELVMGRGRQLRDFLYLYIGTFIGGGLVLDGRLHQGPRGNAGAVGSLPAVDEGGEKPRQLLHKASGLVLEELLRRHGIPATAAHDERALGKKAWRATSVWLDDTGPALAHTVTAATALLDLEAVVIDGSMHRRVVDEVLLRTDRVLDRYCWEGITRPRLVLGSVGPDARAMGGAILPLYRHFAPSHELFFKAEADR